MKPIGVVKFGGITLIISGVLFFTQYLFVLPAGAPPLADADLMAWVQEWRFYLSMADELLFFATLLLIPSIAALYRILVKVDKLKTLLGCGLLAVIIPIYIFLDIVLGRLVYPVYELELSPEIFKLVLSIYYGGMHSAAIILCMATILLCLILRKSVLGKPVANFGFVVAALDLIGAYPWLLATPIVFVSQLAPALWFAVLGISMVRRSRETEE